MTNKRRHIAQQPGTKSGLRPGDKPLVKRTTAGQRLVLFFHRFAWVFCWGYSTIVWGLGETVVSSASRPVGVPSCPFPPRPAVPLCAAPSRPARGMSGFRISTNDANAFHSFQNQSNAKPGHTTGGSGRGGTQRGSGAELGRAERDAHGSVRPGDNRPSCPPELPEHRRQLSWTTLRKHEQTNSY